ncbi:2-oxo acid dehydrogenase subunit E2 [Alphaproteobacteria bacterium]|nr:2-oxo acid dehydrogenase subunit E2 [Alphaproteobacteria bacterium]
MLFEVNLPSLSPTMEEGKIVKWVKKENDPILSGEVLFEVETDKATMEYESPEDGYIAKILFPEGSIAKVNELVAIISDSKNIQDSELNKFISDNNNLNTVDEKNLTISKNDELPTKNSLNKIMITPLAKKIANTKGINIENIIPSSRRIHLSDLNQIGNKENNLVSNKIFISPFAKSLANKNSIDINEIKGTGPLNRIIERDIIGTSSKHNNSKVNKLRQAIAKATIHSKQNIPHFYLNTKVNMNNLLQYRKIQKQKGNKYSFNAILMQSIALAFDQFSDANCTYLDNGDFYLNKDINIGIAVDTKTGLKMPVFKKINSKDLPSINNGLNDLINLTRENKISPSDLSGGVISISNLGSYNIRSFDAIILPGQTYILAVGQIFEDVFVNKGKIEIASFVNLTLSCDHRAVDGVLAAQFLSSIVSNLEKINND